MRVFDIVLTMHGLGRFDEETKNSILIDLGGLAVRILALDRIIKSKETVGRPKDILTLPALGDLPGHHPEKEGREDPSV